MSGREADVTILGAGAAGLGVAAALDRLGVDDVVVLERAGAVASSWRARYDGLRLNTVRALSGLPGEPIPASAGTWASRDAFIGYLEEVAIGSGSTCGSGSKRNESIAAKGSGWRLLTSSGSLNARFVVVAAGYDRVPRMPDWPGRDTFTGELHARLGLSQRGPVSRQGRARRRRREHRHGDRDPARRHSRTGPRVVSHAGEHHAAELPGGAVDLPRPDERERTGGARGPWRLPDAAPRLGRPHAIRHAAAPRTASPRSCG